MKRSTLFICLLALLALAFGQTAQANTGWHAKASGPWSSTSTWDMLSVPTAGANVYIDTNFTVTVDINNAACYSLTLGNNSVGFGILKFNNSSQLTVNSTFYWGTGTAADSGTIDMTSGGTLILNGTVTVTTAQAHLYAGTGTVNYNAAGAQAVAGFTYENLTLSGSGVKTTANDTVNGILSMEGTATASVAPTYGSAATLQYNTATGGTAGVEWITPFVATGGVIIANTGIITMDAAKVFDASVPLTIQSGAALSMSTFLLTLNGDLINNGGTVGGGSGGVTITGTATQSIGSFSTAGIVSMTKTAGTATFTGNSNGDGGLTINGSGGTLDIGGGTHTFDGTWTMTAGTVDGGGSGGTLRFGGGVSGTGGTFTANSSTVQWYANGPQTIAGVTYNNLQLSGSGAKTVTGATVNGQFALGGTATVIGTPTYGVSSQLYYEGSAQQTTGPELPATMAQPVNIYNSNGVVLGGSTTINGMLTFNAGNLSLGANTLTLGGGVSGAAATQCVVTNGSGYVSRDIASGSSAAFPIGPSTTTYNLVEISNNTGLIHTYTAQVAVGDNPTTPDNTQAGNQTWTLTGTATGAGVDLFFHWLTSDAGVHVTPASAVAWYNNGTAWVQAGGTTATGTPNVTTVGGVPSLSPPWIIGNPNALPIQLASLTANAVANNVNLEWSTISETNTLGFYVERGTGKTGPFTAVSSLIPGAGTSTAQHNYSYADNSVSSGTYYYRLHEVDKNGKGSYSTVITVTVAGVLGVREEEGVPTVFKLQQNYPNPFNPTTDIKFWIKDAAFTTLKVYNSLGQEVASMVNGMMQPGRYVATWDASASPSGVYFYRLTSGSNVSAQRMLMIK